MQSKTEQQRERTRRKIARLHAQRKSYHQIAEALGWDNDTARVSAELSRMRRAGWSLEDRRPVDPNTMRLRKASAALMWEDGFAVAQIAATLEIGLGACSSMLGRMRAAGEIASRREPRSRAAPARELIASLAAEGHSYKEIAARTSRTTSEVAGRISEARRLEQGGHETTRVPRRRANGQAEARHAEILRLASQGRTAVQIAERLGYTVGSVQTLISAHRQR